MSTTKIDHSRHLFTNSSSEPNYSFIPPASREELAMPAGDSATAAFDELVQRHRDMCTKRAFMILRNQSDGEEAVQDAFRKAFQHRHQFNGGGTVAAWLHRIVENECLMRLRKQRNAHFVYLDEPSQANNRLEVVDSDMNPEDEFGRQEVLNKLREEMLRMPPLFRDVMLLHDRDQLEMPAVAQRLGLSVPAAKSRLLRGRREFRSRLEKHCGRKGPGTLLELVEYSRTAYARAN